jgi:hypothetical protein
LLLSRPGMVDKVKVTRSVQTPKLKNLEGLS